MPTDNKGLEPGQLPHDQLIDLQRAHDVRSLKECHGCRQIGQAPAMLHVDVLWYHGRCYAEAYSEAALQSLPPRQLCRLQIGDVGLKLARRIIEQLSERDHA